MCRHYCSCDPSDMTITEAGWRLYDNLSPQWMGMYVSSLSVSVRTCGFYVKKTSLKKYKQQNICEPMLTDILFRIAQTNTN